MQSIDGHKHVMPLYMVISVNRKILSRLVLMHVAMWVSFLQPYTNVCITSEFSEVVFL